MLFWTIPPEFGLFFAVVAIGWLIVHGAKSVGRKMTDSTDKAMDDMDWKEFKKQVGPMTWEERIFTVLLGVLLVAIVVWIARCTT